MKIIPERLVSNFHLQIGSQTASDHSWDSFSQSWNEKMRAVQCHYCIKDTCGRYTATPFPSMKLKFKVLTYEQKIASTT